MCTFLLQNYLVMATISANEKQWEKSEKARWLLPGKTEPNSVTDSQESIALFRSGSHKDLIEFIRKKHEPLAG